MKKTNSWLTCSGVKTIKKYCFSAVNSTLEKSQLRANFKNKNLLHTLLQTLKSHDRKSGKRFIRFQRFTRRRQQRHELLDVLPDASKATLLDDFGDSYIRTEFYEKIIKVGDPFLQSYEELTQVIFYKK